MSCEPRPSTRSTPDAAALTQQQRRGLNDIRPPIPRDPPDRTAEPLLISKALGMRILNAVHRSGVAQELETQLDLSEVHRGPNRRISVKALLVAMIVAANDPCPSNTRTGVVLARVGLDADVAYEMGVRDAREWESVTYKTVTGRLRALEALLTAEQAVE